MLTVSTVHETRGSAALIDTSTGAASFANGLMQRAHQSWAGCRADRPSQVAEKTGIRGQCAHRALGRHRLQFVTDGRQCTRPSTII